MAAVPEESGSGMSFPAAGRVARMGGERRRAGGARHRAGAAAAGPAAGAGPQRREGADPVPGQSRGCSEGAFLCQSVQISTANECGNGTRVAAPEGEPRPVHGPLAVLQGGHRCTGCVQAGWETLPESRRAGMVGRDL